MKLRVCSCLPSLQAQCKSATKASTTRPLMREAEYCSTPCRTEGGLLPRICEDREVKVCTTISDRGNCHDDLVHNGSISEIQAVTTREYGRHLPILLSLNLSPHYAYLTTWIASDTDLLMEREGSYYSLVLTAFLSRISIES